MKRVKRWLSALLVLVMVAGLMPVQAEAANLRSGDWEYTISSSGATVTKYNGYDSDVTIPSMLGGQTVTSIGSYAMEDNFYVTSLTIPRKVTSIGYHAFKGCTRLSKIYYNADNCDADYNRPFENAGTSASSLSVKFGSSVKYVSPRLFDAYNENDYVRITSVEFSSSVTTIGAYAFARCHDLSTISWSDHITNIEEGAFCGCTSLKVLSLPTSLIKIGSYAFEDNYLLTSLTIPSKVTSIGYHAFKGCTRLSKINFNAVGCDADYSRPFENVGTSASSLSVTFGPSVRYISSRLFDAYNQSDYARITDVTVSTSVTSIGDYAFALCQDLRSITIPSNVASIGEGAFVGCSNLTISGQASSAAHKYAIENGIKFKSTAASKLATPKITKVQNVTGGIQVRWNKVSGAAKYRVFYKTKNGSWTKIGDTTGTALTWKGAKCGTGYHFTVRCVSKDGKKYTSDYNTKGVYLPCAAVPTLSAAVNSKTRAAALRWKKPGLVNGYQIQYSTDKTFKTGCKKLMVKNGNTLTKTITNLTRNKTYYFRVQSYKTMNGKNYYSAWSKVKNLKITNVVHLA